MMPSGSGWVRLNVGGQMLETSLSTVTKYQDSVLAKMFLDAQDVPSIDKVYNIDCDPSAFKVILSWLRLDVLTIPQDLNKEILIGTAKHLGLKELVTELCSKDDRSKGAMTDWIKLNVGGTLFETSRSTLTSDSCSTLSRMFEPNSNLPPATINDGVYQIDACPHSFGVILNWLRYRSLILGDVKPDDVLPVADYFGLSELRTLLEKRRELMNEEQGRYIECIEGSVEKLEEVLQQIESEIAGINEKMEDFKVEMSAVATGMEDVWRLKCELANISQIIANGFKSLK